MDNLFIEYEKEIYQKLDILNIQTNRYFISNYGNIIDSEKDKMVTITKSKNGYLLCNLYDNNKARGMYYLHRLVALKFIPKTIEDINLNRDEINHKDCNKQNNYYKNLEWCTGLENTTHAILHNLKTNICTNSNHEEYTIHLICQSIVNGLDDYNCCLMANLEPNKQNKEMVMRIRYGHRWRNISSKYNINYNDRKGYAFQNDVLKVCEFLQNNKNLTIKEICTQLGFEYEKYRHFVRRIKNRESYTDISKDYNF